MQQPTKEIQIHVRGSALIQLHFAGRCVGFAMTYRSAGHQADQLDRLLFAIRHHGRNSPRDATANVSFSSLLSEKAEGRVTGVTKEAWVVEAEDGTPVRAFPSREVAEWFRGTVEAYDRLMPPSGEGGEWTADQIEWFRNHPAPIVSACGGRSHVRWAGWH